MKTRNINRNKLGAFIMALMIVAYIVPLCVAGGGSGEPSGDGKYPEVPGAPDNAVQYNKTETTPVAEMAQVAAGEQALFQYRHMTMLMNCSKNCDVVFNSDPNVKPKILGLSVEPNQRMTLTINT